MKIVFLIWSDKDTIGGGLNTHRLFYQILFNHYPYCTDVTFLINQEVIDVLKGGRNKNNETMLKV